jgi:hypothetical protein
VFLRIIFVLGLISGSSAHAFMSTQKLDVIFVIDDSGSMQIHQQNLGSAVSAIPKYVGKVDINASVITTSVEGGGRIVAPILNSSSPSFVTDLGQVISVGTGGSAVEEPFATLSAALSPQMLSGINSGVVRPDADLMIVFLTDTEDQSSMPSMTVGQQLKSIKGNQQVFVLAGMPDRSNKSCQAEDMEPLKITELVQEFNGQVFDICSAPQFPTNFSKAIVQALNLEAQ